MACTFVGNCCCRPRRFAESFAFLPPRPASYWLARKGSVEALSLLDADGADNAFSSDVWRTLPVISRLRMPAPSIIVTSASTPGGVRVPVFLFLYPRPAVFTLLYSHGNAADAGMLRDAMIDLCLNARCNVALYEYDGYGPRKEASAKPSVPSWGGSKRGGAAAAAAAIEAAEASARRRAEMLLEGLNGRDSMALSPAPSPTSMSPEPAPAHELSPSSFASDSLSAEGATVIFEAKNAAAPLDSKMAGAGGSDSAIVTVGSGLRAGMPSASVHLEAGASLSPPLQHKRPSSVRVAGGASFLDRVSSMSSAAAASAPLSAAAMPQYSLMRGGVGSGGAAAAPTAPGASAPLAAATIDRALSWGVKKSGDGGGSAGGRGASASGPAEPSEEGTFASVEAVYRLLLSSSSELPPCVRTSAERLILYGHSLGSGPTLHLASTLPARAVILHAPLASGLRMASSLRCCRALCGCCEIFDNVSRARRLHGAARNVLVMHGAADEVIPVKQGREVWGALPEALRKRNDMWCPLNAKHNDIVETNREEYYGRLRAFMEQLVGEDGAGDAAGSSVVNTGHGKSVGAGGSGASAAAPAVGIAGATEGIVSVQDLEATARLWWHDSDLAPLPSGGGRPLQRKGTDPDESNAAGAGMRGKDDPPSSASTTPLSLALGDVLARVAVVVETNSSAISTSTPGFAARASEAAAAASPFSSKMASAAGGGSSGSGSGGTNDDGMTARTPNAIPAVATAGPVSARASLSGRIPKGASAILAQFQQQQQHPGEPGLGGSGSRSRRSVSMSDINLMLRRKVHGTPAIISSASSASLSSLAGGGGSSGASAAEGSPSSLAGGGAIDDSSYTMTTNGFFSESPTSASSAMAAAAATAAAAASSLASSGGRQYAKSFSFISLGSRGVGGGGGANESLSSVATTENALHAALSASSSSTPSSPAFRSRSFGDALASSRPRAGSASIGGDDHLQSFDDVVLATLESLSGGANPAAASSLLDGMAALGGPNGGAGGGGSISASSSSGRLRVGSSDASSARSSRFPSVLEIGEGGGNDDDDAHGAAPAGATALAYTATARVRLQVQKARTTSTSSAGSGGLPAIV